VRYLQEKHYSETWLAKQNTRCHQQMVMGEKSKK